MLDRDNQITSNNQIENMQTCWRKPVRSIASKKDILMAVGKGISYLGMHRPAIH